MDITDGKDAITERRAALQEIIKNTGCRGQDEVYCASCTFKHEGDSGCLLAYPYIGSHWSKETLMAVGNFCYTLLIDPLTGEDKLAKSITFTPAEGRKFDQGKPDWSLMDLSVIEEWAVCSQMEDVQKHPYEAYMYCLECWQKGDTIETLSGRSMMAVAAAAYMRGVCHIPFSKKKYVSSDIWKAFPVASLEDMVKVLTHGAVKYARDNWQRVPDARNRYFAALFRHNVSVMKGDAIDPEFGLPHTAHALCNLYFLTWFNMQDILAGKNKKEMQ